MWLGVERSVRKRYCRLCGGTILPNDPVVITVGKGRYGDEISSHHPECLHRLTTLMLVEDIDILRELLEPNVLENLKDSYRMALLNNPNIPTSFFSAILLAKKVYSDLTLAEIKEVLKARSKKEEAKK